MSLERRRRTKSQGRKSDITPLLQGDLSPTEVLVSFQLDTEVFTGKSWSAGFGKPCILHRSAEGVSRDGQGNVFRTRSQNLVGAL